jgi:nucleotide-binding universal stress UspA family protein
MQNILLVPLDGSTFAEQALIPAVDLARRMNSRLHLVRVRASLPIDVSGSDAEIYIERIYRKVSEQLPGQVEARVLTDEFGPLEYPPPASTLVADVLARFAVEHDVTFTIMATHGHGGVRRAWLGSVADSLIRLAPRPVLLIRPSDDAPGEAARVSREFRHILVPLDGSRTAERAIPNALRIGTLYNARYTLLRVTSPLSWDIAPHAWEPAPARTPPLSTAAAEAYLNEQAAAMRREHGVRVDTAVIDGASAGPAIIEYAEAHGVDLIAMGTEGAGQIRRLLLGSVTDKIVRSSNAPVLVCNARRALDAPVLATASAETAGQ